MRETWVRFLGWEDAPGEGKGYPTPIFWSGEFHGLYSSWGHKESEITERLKKQNVAYSLKYTGKPILKALNFKSITFSIHIGTES